MASRLPKNKLSKLIDLIDGVWSVHKVTLKQLQSGLGQLVLACRIMPMGRVFSRHLFLATRGVTLSSHCIRITRPLRSDFQVW